DLFSKIYNSGCVTNNSYFVKEFEHQLKLYSQSNYVLSLANGTLGLHLALRTLEKEGEVITTPFSFIASSSSIIWEGFKPIFCDIDKETLCISPEAIKEKINKITVAIMAVHLF